MMSKTPVYLVVGRGRWASLIQSVLQSEHRSVTTFGEARIRIGEAEAEYQARLEQAMETSGASVAWLCLPFGPWIPIMCAAAMFAGLDVIAECPWLCTAEVTQSLLALEKQQHRSVSVHYEYCLLDELTAWVKKFGGGAGLTFNGAFNISRPGRHGSNAMLQLGSHLLSIWQFAVPEANLGELHCGYESADQRMVWLSRDGAIASRVDFLANTQPLIQRYIHRFEDGLKQRNFIFGMKFAERIATQVRSLA